MKHLLLIPAFLVCLSSNAFAAVYQHTDENGRIVFTDKPVSGSIERKVQSPAVITIKKDEPAKKIEKPDNSAFGDVRLKRNQPKKYSKFAIKSPQHDVAFRENMGNVSIKLDISPELQKRFGHHIKVALDGTILPKKWKSSSFSIFNVDRGTHTLQVFLMNKKGTKIKSSKKITFHLQRFSRLFR